MITGNLLLLGLLVGFALATLLDYLIEITSRELPLFSKSPPCPACNEYMGVSSQIPVIGYALMLGRCPHCGRNRSRTLPLMEILLISFSVWSFATLGISAAFQMSLLFMGLIGVTIVDIKKWIIPNYFVLIIVFVALIAIVLKNGNLLNALSGLGVATVVSLLLVIPQRFGSGDKSLALGDVKLCLAVGLWLGWVLAIYAFFVASLLASLIWIISGLFQGYSIQRRLQFGPFVALSTLLFGIGRAVDPQFVTHLLTFRF
ncbi:MAG: prepilin peptidase [Candidatus Marinimicrobia bacterium]|nr:prepilin peptidase [Candidatus Neomarinimicrobiota bacterium]